ncbi:MAG: hypothetical protein ACKVQW_03835 [Pyrinomonadaceae bacterium]
MKRCPQCNNLFDDINDYCLNDGTPLTASVPSYPSQQEIPTVAWNPHTRTPTYSGEVGKSATSNTALFVMFGIILLLAVAAVGFAVAYFISGRDDSVKTVNQTTTPTVENSAPKTNSQNSSVAATPERPVVTSTPKIETVRPPGARGGLINRPPSNVRFTPNGDVQCTVKSRTTINIYGDTGVYDNNGLWYYTDVCGRQGVIHSTQFQFTK